MAINRLDVVDFGVPAAEREQSLDRMFVELDVYQRVCSGQTRVILGNRGVGKSAILKMLARRARARQSQVIELIPEDYSYEILQSTTVRESEGAYAKQGAYAAAWKYMLYTEVMRVIASREGKSDSRHDTKIRRYIRDHNRQADAGKFGTLMSYLKRLEGVKIGPYEASVKAKELEKLYRLEEISFLLDEIAAACSSRHVYVLIDELDKGWDASEDAKSFVAGLFQACLSINKLCPGLRVYISLRQELYDTIPALYEDAQKYRDLVEKISWSRRELVFMIAQRIRRSVPKTSDLSDEQAWSRVFDYRMQDGTRSIDYMIDRTLSRPRELIQYCAESVQHARRIGHVGLLADAAIREVESAYSHERLQDIAAEYRFPYRGLESVFEAFRGTGPVLPREELEFLALQIVVGEVAVRVEAKEWISEQDEQALVYVLWHVGFLQAESPTRGEDVPAFTGRHENPYILLANVRRFRVHPGFHAYLGMRDIDAR